MRGDDICDRTPILVAYFHFLRAMLTPSDECKLDAIESEEFHLLSRHDSANIGKVGTEDLCYKSYTYCLVKLISLFISLLNLLFTHLLITDK